MYYYIVNNKTDKAFVKSKDKAEIEAYCAGLKAIGHSVSIRVGD